MSDELREAAERLARSQLCVKDCKHIWNAHRQCQWCHSMQRDVDVMLVADAYLADMDLRQREAEERALPVTPDTMWEFGYGDGAYSRDAKRFEICDSIRLMFFACEGPQRWNGQLWIGKYKQIENPTRGQVLDLLKALGVKGGA